MKDIYSSEYKLKVVLSSFKRKGTVLDFCSEHGISRSRYYRWVNLFFQGGQQALALSKDHSTGSCETKQLQNENENLKRLLAEAILKAPQTSPKD